ncbi:MAG: S8 family serine peptidase [Syntrophothermus sp.]|uniref:S8 family serine peptidase n=1 Tax=Syntrophothermus sp. TaxID=2736299 RepID=UPI00257F395F|nr:S8 family serine peptidase [Syntrophothermus sp.]NSW83668.1 S8 family serine peptidase [Syntrophothermus sp.]
MVLAILAIILSLGAMAAPVVVWILGVPEKFPDPDSIIWSMIICFLLGLFMFVEGVVNLQKKRAAAAGFPPAKKEAVTPKCSGCGREISDQFVVCPFCGRYLKEPGTASSEVAVPAALEKVRPRGRKGRVVVAVLVTLLAIGGLVAAEMWREGSRAPVLSVTSDRERQMPPVILQYPGKDGKPKSAYGVPGCVTIIAKQDAAPEAVRALVAQLGGTVYAELPDSSLYFSRGFTGREADVIAALYKNSSLVQRAFPTPPAVAKGVGITEEFKTWFQRLLRQQQEGIVWAIDDMKTIIAADGRYLHADADGGLFWSEDSNNALTHAELVGLLMGIREGNVGVIDCAVTVKDQSGGESKILMDTASALEKAAEIARMNNEQGKVTIFNNSWGAYFEDTSAFVAAEADSYRTLLQFLNGNPNAVAVKSIGNEGVDLSKYKDVIVLRREFPNVWKRFVLVGVLDDKLQPTPYSNRNVGHTTGILWVPELRDRDGNPVPGTSFAAARISALLGRIARARPDLSPEQLVTVLFDQRVSPRVNLRPTIKDPLSDETLNKALKVAAERFPASENPASENPASENKKPVKPVGEQAASKLKADLLTPARDLTGTWKTTFGAVFYQVDPFFPSTRLGTLQADLALEIRQKGNSVTATMHIKPKRWEGKDLGGGQGRFPAPREMDLPMSGMVEGARLKLHFHRDPAPAGTQLAPGAVVAESRAVDLYFEGHFTTDFIEGTFSGNLFRSDANAIKLTRQK